MVFHVKDAPEEAGKGNQQGKRTTMRKKVKAKL